jgi:hypothetical protein
MGLVVGLAGQILACTIRVVDDRIDKTELTKVLEQQKFAILLQAHYLEGLQAKGILPKPEKGK